MSVIVFGLVSGLADQLATFVIKCLAVGGGFLVGYAVGGMIGWGLNRWIFRQKAPDLLKQCCKLVAGVAAALLVALIVFGEGGNGLFGGSGSNGEGQGNPVIDPNANPNSPSPPEKDQKVDSTVVVPKIDTTPTDVIVRVTIIAGAAVPAEGKYYLLDDDRVPKTLLELKRAIAERKSREKGKMTLAILFPTDRNIAPSDRKESKVTDVTRWATEEAGLDVMYPAARQ